jgi:hypothetical protein
MKNLIPLAVFLIFWQCATPSRATRGPAGKGDTRTVDVLFLDDNTYLLTDTTSDATYGYTKGNPVNVGGIHESMGPQNQRRFLNALLGPQGEPVSYYRAGSCCGFKTPNGLIGDMGLLDRYRVTWEGARDTVDIYLNLYDKGNLYIPVGFTAKKK